MIPFERASLNVYPQAVRPSFLQAHGKNAKKESIWLYHAQTVDGAPEASKKSYGNVQAEAAREFLKATVTPSSPGPVTLVFLAYFSIVSTTCRLLSTFINQVAGICRVSIASTDLNKQAFGDWSGWGSSLRIIFY